jgi:hypothetical protein
MLNSDRFRSYHIPILILIALLSRLPQLLSPNLLLDGDECIVGLMARHLHEGREFPVYFYGQGYGLSLPENALISLFYLFTGYTDWGIKLAMLMLWTGGIIFFYLTARHLLGKERAFAAFLLSLLFILSPAWAVWSMKARGGYLTAFLLFNLSVYLSLHHKAQSAPLAWFATGLMTIVIYESQSLWIPGLLILLWYMLFRLRSLRLLLFHGAGIGLAILGFQVLKQYLGPAYSPSFISQPDWERIAALPSLLWMNFSGSYAFGSLLSMSLATRVMTLLMLLLCAILMAWSIYVSVRKRFTVDIIPALALALPVSILAAALTENMAARYLLPVWGLVMLMMIVFVMQYWHSRILRGSIMVMLLIGSLSLFSFRDYRYERRSELMSCLNYLNDNEIEFVFAEGGLLQWQLMFYSGEDVRSRFLYRIDRYQPYVDEVNLALKRNSKKIGLMGYPSEGDTIAERSFISPGGTYFILKEPDSVLLAKRGFEFN